MTLSVFGEQHIEHQIDKDIALSLRDFSSHGQRGQQLGSCLYCRRQTTSYYMGNKFTASLRPIQVQSTLEMIVDKGESY